MSLISLAAREVRETTRRRSSGALESVRVETAGPPAAVSSAVQRLVSFIPTETIALFWLAVPAAAALTEFRTEAKPTGATGLDWAVYAGLLALTPVLLVLSYLSGLAAAGAERPPIRAWPWWKAGASTVAFAAWAFAVPGNPFVRETPVLMAAWVVATVVSTVLALIDPIVQAWSDSEDRPGRAETPVDRPAVSPPAAAAEAPAVPVTAALESATATAPVGVPGDRFASAADARAAHARLLASLPGDPGPADLDRGAEFIRKAVATGVVLDAPEDRKEVQALVDYWSASLVAQAREADGHRAAARVKPATTVLVPFDPAVLDAAAAAAEAWVRGQPPEVQATARRILLRVVRLQTAGGRFEPAPTVRGALYDFADPAEVERVLTDLTAVGVLRLIPGDVTEMDRVVLRSADLMTRWPALAGWLRDRAAFRSRVAAWEAGGKQSLDPVPSEFEVEEFRLYHDRDARERAYIEACRRRDRRRRELLRGGVVLLALALLVVLPLSIASWVGWARADRNAEAAQAEQRKAERATARLARQERMVRTLQVVRTLAEVGAARTDGEVNVALKRWKDLATQILAHEAARPDQPPYFTEFLGNRFPGTRGLDGLEAAVRAAKAAADREAAGQFRELDKDTRVPVAWYATDAWRAFNRRVLGTAHELRNDLLASPDDELRPELESELKAIQAVAYSRVRFCVDEMLAILKDRPFDAAAPVVREFWLNYWGDLGLVEGVAVTQAMVRFGGRLREIEERLPAFAAADNFYSYRRNVEQRAVKDRPSPTDLVRPDAAARYEANRQYRDYSRMLFREELDRLSQLAGPLRAALTKELAEPIQPHTQPE
jgi:hypothetical protein